MTAYYNENDPFAADWLRNLIKAGLIAPGEVDERDIQDVRPTDLTGFAQCHFFAGIGGWSQALRLAGWPDDRPVWTGSCPCQPFSAAGARKGFDDERHLWPAWYWLIRQRRPTHIFGEQVAGTDGLKWLDLVCTDLEAGQYAVGPVIIPVAGVGSPHGRHRIYFVADAGRAPRLAEQFNQSGERSRRQPPTVDATGLGERGKISRLADATSDRATGNAGIKEGTRGPYRVESGGSGKNDSMASPVDNPTDPRHDNKGQHESGPPPQPARFEQSGTSGELGDSERKRSQLRGHKVVQGTRGRSERGKSISPSNPPRPGFWDNTEWLACIDGKARPVEPGTFPLAYGVPGRVGRLRAYGNAITPQAAEQVIRAFMDREE